MGFKQPTTLCSDLLFVLPAATISHFGVLASTMHNAWVRYTYGRLESRYRYAAAIVYNNFPWPEKPTDKQCVAVEVAAQGVLDARARFPGASLADLNDPLTMPSALSRAHQQLDAAVDAAYGQRIFTNDAARTAFLFERYRVLASPTVSERDKFRPPTWRRILWAVLPHELCARLLGTEQEPSPQEMPRLQDAS